MFLKLEDLRKMAEQVDSTPTTEFEVILLRWYHDCLAFRKRAISAVEHTRNKELARNDLQLLLPAKSVTVSHADGSVLIAPRIGVRTGARR